MSKVGLRDALALGPSLPRLGAAFKPARTLAAAGHVARKLQNVQAGAGPARDYDLDSLHRRVRRAWLFGGGTQAAALHPESRSLADLSPFDLRRLPWVLCYPPDGAGARRRRRSGARWLAEDRHLIRRYGEWLSEGRRNRAVRTLLHVFLRDYPVRLDSFEYLRSILKTEVARRQEPPPSAWALPCRKYGLLEKGSSRSFVNRTIADETPVDGMLQAAGFVGPLERSAFIREGLLGYLSAGEAVASLVRAPETTRLGRLLALLQCGGRLRFDEPRTRRAIAEGLLSPLAANAPTPAVREELRGFFLRRFGDPRLPSGRQRWHGVREDVRRVVIRWLNEESFGLFLRVVEETALDKHWRYRNTFWKTCFDGGMIDDVWFVLGRGARKNLRRLRRGGDAAETTAFLTGATRGQSVLLMKLASGVTIAEWSHNGSCRMWLRGNPEAPRLYRRTYDRSDLTWGEDHRQAHHGSDRGRWQNAIADWLFENTGLVIDRSDFLPKFDRQRSRW